MYRIQERELPRLKVVTYTPENVHFPRKWLTTWENIFTNAGQNWKDTLIFTPTVNYGWVPGDTRTVTLHIMTSR